MLLFIHHPYDLTEYSEIVPLLSVERILLKKGNYFIYKVLSVSNNINKGVVILPIAMIRLDDAAVQSIPNCFKNI